LQRVLAHVDARLVASTPQLIDGKYAELRLFLRDSAVAGTSGTEQSVEAATQSTTLDHSLLTPLDLESEIWIPELRPI
jgi:hypothetical protein